MLKDENIIGSTVAFCKQSSGRDIELILTERHHCEKVSWRPEKSKTDFLVLNELNFYASQVLIERLPKNIFNKAEEENSRKV